MKIIFHFIILKISVYLFLDHTAISYYIRFSFIGLINCIIAVHNFSVVYDKRRLGVVSDGVNRPSHRRLDTPPACSGCDN